MILKQRKVSLELLYWRSLFARKCLSEKEKSKYFYLEKGFEGEQKFDLRLNELLSDCIILQDLILEHNNSVFQIDSTLITPLKIHLFEVKNFEGNYYLEGDRWYSENGTEIKSPVDQTKRIEILFRQFIQPLKSNLAIHSHIIFINPEFTLFEAKKDLPLVLPTQLTKFLPTLECPGTMNTSNKRLSQYLVSKSLVHSPYIRLPDIPYEKMKKGVFCENCLKSMELSCRNKLHCPHCNAVTKLDAAIIRTVEEFRLLFPNSPITINALLDWCGAIVSKKVLRRIVQTNYKQANQGKSTHYIYDKELV